MRCPVCGKAELVRDTRDLAYTYEGETTVIPGVTADFCPACEESITDAAESDRVMREMLAFNKQVDRGCFAKESCRQSRLVAQTDITDTAMQQFMGEALGDVEGWIAENKDKSLKE